MRQSRRLVSKWAVSDEQQSRSLKKVIELLEGSPRMGKIKVVFFDIDGTLVNFHAGKSSVKVIEALERLKKNGIKLVIATGRGPIQIPPFPEGLFDAYLCFNGSYAFDQEGDIISHPLPLADIKQLIRNGQRLKRPIIMATAKRLVANGMDPDLEEYMSFGPIKAERLANFDELVGYEPIYQMMMSGRKEDYATTLEGVQAIKIAAWWERAFDLIPAVGGKGQAVEEILKYYGLTPEEAMAFGDGNNDLPMFEVVGHGVAMGNASEELKAAARDVCRPVQEDGIYHYLLEQGLI